MCGGYTNHSFIHLPMKMELIEASETSDFRTQTPENYPKENILHKRHGESLKSRKSHLMFYLEIIAMCSHNHTKHINMAAWAECMTAQI